MDWDFEKNKECLVWDIERGTKTRTGATHSHQRAFNPIAHEFDGGRCPVKIYKEYVKRRPVEACTPDSRFYLTPIPENRLKPNAEKWFYASPMGKNNIGKMLKGVDHLVQKVGSRAKVSNHSVRKTSICRLLQNGVHPVHVTQLSGHKNIDSLKSYNVASADQQREMSDIINAQDFGPNSSSPSTSSLPTTVSCPSAVIPSAASQSGVFSSAMAATSSASAAANLMQKRHYPDPENSVQTSNNTNTIEISSSSANLSEGLFRGATIQNVYVFNGPFPVFPQKQEQQPPMKKRRIINDLDEE